MKLKKVSSERWITSGSKYRVTIHHGRIKGLYPKYYVSGGLNRTAFAHTLKEAQAIIDRWEREEA